MLTAMNILLPTNSRSLPTSLKSQIVVYSNFIIKKILNFSLVKFNFIICIDSRKQQHATSSGSHTIPERYLCHLKPKYMPFCYGTYFLFYFTIVSSLWGQFFCHVKVFHCHMIYIPIQAVSHGFL